MAETDLSAVNQYKTKIKQAASSLCVDAGVIAGNFNSVLLYHG